MILAAIIALGLGFILAAFVKTRRNKERTRTEMLRKLGNAIIHPKITAEAEEISHGSLRREMPLKTEQEVDSAPNTWATAEELKMDSRRNKTEKKTFTTII
jgi:hypothetical protein